jgi:hypothetical protein
MLPPLCAFSRGHHHGRLNIDAVSIPTVTLDSTIVTVLLPTPRVGQSRSELTHKHRAYLGRQDRGGSLIRGHVQAGIDPNHFGGKDERRLMFESMEDGHRSPLSVRILRTVQAHERRARLSEVNPQDRAESLHGVPYPCSLNDVAGWINVTLREDLKLTLFYLRVPSRPPPARDLKKIGNPGNTAFDRSSIHGFTSSDKEGSHALYLNLDEPVAMSSKLLPSRRRVFLASAQSPAARI